MRYFKIFLLFLFVLTSVVQVKANPIPPYYLVEKSSVHQEGEVLFSAFSHDGRLLAISSGDQVKLWRTSDLLLNGSNAEVLAILEHTGDIPMLIFSPDDQYLLTNSYNNSSKLWRVDDLISLGGDVAVPVATLNQLPDADKVMFSSDGRFILGTSTYVRLWKMSDLLDGEGRKSDLINQGFVPEISFSDRSSVYGTFSPDSRYIVITYSDGTAKIWNVEEALSNLDSVEMKYTGRRVLSKPVATIDHRSNGLIYHAAYSHDGEKILTSSRDRTARLWSVKDLLNGVNSELIVYQHDREVIRGAFRQDNKLILTHTLVNGKGFDPYYNPARDYSTHLWSMTKPPSLPFETDESSSMSAPVQTAPLTVFENVRGVFSPDGQLILGYSGDSVSLWRINELLLLNGDQTPLESVWHGGEVRHSTFNPSGTLIVSSSNDRTFKVLLRDSSENKEVRLAELESGLNQLNRQQQVQMIKLRLMEEKLNNLTQSEASGGEVIIPSIMLVVAAAVSGLAAP